MFSTERGGVDLLFCRLVLEMFFEEAVEALRPVVQLPNVSPARPRLGPRFPNIVRAPVGAAHVHLNLHQYSVLCRKTFLACRTAESLGCARDDKRDCRGFHREPVSGLGTLEVFWLTSKGSLRRG